MSRKEDLLPVVEYVRAQVGHDPQPFGKVYLQRVRISPRQNVHFGWADPADLKLDQKGG